MGYKLVISECRGICFEPVLSIEVLENLHILYQGDEYAGKSKEIAAKRCYLFLLKCDTDVKSQISQSMFSAD